MTSFSVSFVLLLSLQAAISGPLSEPLNQFSASLFTQLAKGNAAKNVLVSPFSVSTGLSLVLLGARGKTAQALEQGLHLNQVAAADASVHQLFDQLLENVVNKGSSVSVANLLMIQKEGSENAVLTKFKSDAASLYGARVDDVDFAADGDAIASNANNWVKEKTHGLIESIVDSPIDPLTRVILLNAVHFEGKWDWPFSSDSSSNQTFLNHGTEGKLVPFMLGYDRIFPYKKVTVAGKAAQALEMAYEKDNMSMTIVLPVEKEGLKSILTSPNLATDLSALVEETTNMNKSRRYMDVSLPKFEFDTEYNLKETLSALGMGNLFEATADLSGITGRNDLSLSNAVHKAKIAVDEDGTKAAAVTRYDIVLLSGEKRLQFTADHPFLFFIKDKSADVILFMGTVEQL